MNDNFIILRDEDGTAYIAHADQVANQQGNNKYTNWGKGARRANSKYIARLLENGKYWYAYTQEQLQRHLHETKNKAHNALKEASSIPTSERMDTATANYDKSLAGAVDRTASKARENASNSKGSINNAVTKAQNTYERMRNEFKNKAHEAVGNYDWNDLKARETVSNTRDFVNEMSEKAKSTARNAADKAKSTAQNVENTAKESMDSAKTISKDASENIAVKAKGEVDQATSTVQSMIDNVRSATSRAVKDAWDNIPKNADGTVNPFDKDFSDAYNKWKTATAKYENSLTAKAKEQAKKAADAFDDAVKEARQKIQNGTATIQDYVNSGRDTLNRLTREEKEQPILAGTMQASRNRDEAKKEIAAKSERDKAAGRQAYHEYSDGDPDFADAVYSKENHVEDTDFYTFTRNDGRSVIVEEDMKWVLPKGISANDPTIQRALHKISDAGNVGSTDDWVEYANAIIGEAITKVHDKR